MKLNLVFLFALCAFATSSPTGTKTLGEELKEFRALLPLNKINSLVFRYFANDKEFQDLVAYILSDDVLPGFTEIEQIPEVQATIEYLHNHGSDIYELLNKLHDVLGLQPYMPTRALSKGDLGGLKGFIENLKSLIPVKDLWALYEQKLKTSPVFREFVHFIKNNSQGGVDKVLKNEHIRNLIRFIKKRDVETKVLIDFVTALVGIHIKPVDVELRSTKSDITKDVLDFLNLVPTENIIIRGNTYLKSSYQFKVAYLYMSSKMFQMSLKLCHKTPEVKKLVEYIEYQGLDVKKYAKTAEIKFGYKKFDPREASQDDPKEGNMTDFVNEVMELLPKDLITELAETKTQTVPNFVNFTTSLQSTEIVELYQKVVATNECQLMIQESLAFGVKLDVFVELAYSVIGLDLKSVFNDN